MYKRQESENTAENQKKISKNIWRTERKDKIIQTGKFLNDLERRKYNTVINKTS